VAIVVSTRTRRGLIFIGLLLFPFFVGMLLTYQIIRIPFPSDMVDSIAVDYQEGPRLGPPEGAVPIQGEAIIPEEFPLNPLPADNISIQRGEILYQIHCALCHGDAGKGDGPLASHFARTPENLVGDKAAAEFDGSVYLAIQQGFGEMPSIAENLTVRERWDVVNFIRTLPTSGE
jgi:mono/diheme cytochrome c family protein